MISAAAIKELVNAPELPLIVNELEELLAAERLLRERFYEEMDETRKMEFINGHIIVHSPAKAKHIIVTKRLLVLLDTYVEQRKLGLVIMEKGLVTLSRNDYEPDLAFFGREKANSVSPGSMKFPPPDFVVEVLSESTAEVDRNIKFRDYALHGVGEYWLIDTEKEEVEQFQLQGKEFLLRGCFKEGRITSVAVEGFEIPVKAIFDGAENQRVLRALMSQ